MRKYCINIGNSRVAVCEAPVDATTRVERYERAQWLSHWQLPDAATAVAACVVPAMREALQERYGDRIRFIGIADYPQLDFSNYDYRTLGADRIANAAAVHQLTGKVPVMAIDCGTGLNSVAVDGNGVFRGGVILPGRRPARAALACATAQLPDIPENEVRKVTPLALNTRDAIASGVDLGIAGAIEYIIRATRKQPGMADCIVYLCGGDAEYLAQLIEPALGVRLAPFSLTLYGIHLVASLRSPTGARG